MSLPLWPLSLQVSAALRGAVLCIAMLFCIQVAAQNTDIDQIAQAHVALANHDWDKAESLLQTLTQSQPKNPFIFFDLAQVYENTNRLEAAKKIYQGLTTTLNGSTNQYAVVIRKPYASRMTSLNALAQARLDAINARQGSKIQPLPVTGSAITASAPAQVTPSNITDSPTTSVAAVMKNWVSAWTSKNMTAYYACYVDNYRGNFPTPYAWKRQRLAAIMQAKSIELDVQNMEMVSLSPTITRVHFLQSYTSDLLKEKLYKTLVFVKKDGRWLIEKESIE